MHAIASLTGERFGHKAGFQAMRLGAVGDNTLQQDSLVGGAHDIGAMVEIDFELTGRSFRHNRIHRDTLPCGSFIDIIKDSRILLKRLQRIHILTLRTGSVTHWQRVPLAVQPVRIKQKEFKFESGAGGQPFGGEQVNLARQYLPRVAQKWHPVFILHGQYQLGGILGADAAPAQRAGNRKAETVAVSGIDMQARVIDLTSPDIKPEQGERKIDALAIGLFQSGDRCPLAAQNAVQIGYQKFDNCDLRVLDNKGFGFSVCLFQHNGLGRIFDG